MTSIRWISTAFLLLNSVSGYATARDARTITLDTVKCVRGVMENFFAHEQDLPQLASILETVRVNQNSTEALIGAENQCARMQAHLNDLSVAERAQRRNWGDVKQYQENNLDTVASLFDMMIQQAEVGMTLGLVRMKDLNPNVRSVLLGFIQPMEHCTQADANLALFFLAGKVGGAYCQSTSGRKWLQISGGLGYGLVGGGQVDIGGSRYVNRSWGFIANGKLSERRMRAIMTAGAGEYFCGGFALIMTERELHPAMADCDLTDLADRPANSSSSIGGGIGLGLAPTGGKTVLYSLDVKVFPLGSDFEAIADRLLGIQR